jgi:lantibiotic modifying enzyme
MFSLLIPEKLLNEYREFCDENSINISMRLRKFIERDLEGYRARKLQQQAQQKNNSQS